MPAAMAGFAIAKARTQEHQWYFSCRQQVGVLRQKAIEGGDNFWFRDLSGPTETCINHV